MFLSSFWFDQEIDSGGGQWAERPREMRDKRLDSFSLTNSRNEFDGPCMERTYLTSGRSDRVKRVQTKTLRGGCLFTTKPWPRTCLDAQDASKRSDVRFKVVQSFPSRVADLSVLGRKFLTVKEPFQ